MNLTERITIDTQICHSKPTLRGQRYTVETILELLGSGMTPEDILAGYEDLEHEDILAARPLLSALVRSSESNLRRCGMVKVHFAGINGQYPRDRRRS